MSFNSAWDQALGFEPEDGAAILDEVRGVLVRYVAFPSSEAADAATVYVAATHAQPAWEHATRFLAKSPEKRCGKSRLLEVMRELARGPRSTVNISAAALVRCIDEADPPTLLVDEADRLYGSHVKSDLNEDLTGILDVGFAREWPYTRYNASKNTMEDHPTFAMAILASKGADLPDTIEDRSIIVTMRRRAPGETVAQFRRKNIPELRDLRERISAWVRPRVDVLAEAEPEVPAEDRSYDAWEPLVAVADLAGGDWPERIRRACKVMVADAETADNEASYGVRLLADVRDIFADMTVSFLESRELANQLRSIEDAPWRDIDLSPRGLADRLRPYEVGPRRKGGGKVRGYFLSDFLDAFHRYIPPEAGTPSHPVTPSPEQVSGGDGCDGVTGEVSHPSQGDPAVSSESDTVTGRDGIPLRHCQACGEPLTTGNEFAAGRHYGCPESDSGQDR